MPHTDQVTCPRCLLNFAANGATTPDGATPDVPPAAPGGGTVTILPDEPAAAPAPPVTMAAQPQRVGRFEVVRYLGEGAFGRVFEARDPVLRRTVALKVAKPEQLSGPGRVSRFQREARAAAGLMHPNIVAVFDSGQDGPHHYIASALVPGRSLAAALEELPEGQTLELRQAVQLVRKLAEALAYAHKQGVVHRDVKPGNIMLRDDGEPLLMDFGLAARADESERLTAAGQFMGTPEYTAPEQWRGQASEASDQYALGCLFFELLTSRVPFRGGSSEHFLLLHTQQPAPSPREYRPGLPRDLETVCLKCLDKEPSGRYADCQALADDLRRWLEGEPVSARRAGPLERLGRWARRSPAVAGLAAAVAGSLLLGAAVAAALALHAGEKARQAYQAAQRADEEAEEAAQQWQRAEREAAEATRLAKKEEKARREAQENQRAAKTAAHRADVARHGYQMTAAQEAWQQHDLVTAEQMVEAVPPHSGRPGNTAT